MNPVKHFEKNEVGRDFVVGDIHGSFKLLKKELSVLEFDESKDRLFSVGDLVDRGPNSDEFYKWLDKPWFHAVRGNHDQMLIDTVEDGLDSNAAGLHLMNGGSWFYGLPKTEQQYYATMMKELPLAVEVETDKGLVGIIHAECPLGDWNLFKSLFESNEDYFTQIAMWSRSKISSKSTACVEGVYRLYCGHTVLDQITQLGNVVYIDTGAVFKDGKLSILQIN